MNRNPIVIGIVAPILLAACGGSEAPEATSEPAVEVASAGLTEEALQRLMTEYPVLREDPAPPPQPNGSSGEASGAVLETVEGEATFYADQFEGRRTASGVPFRQNQFVAAHRAFPFGTLLRVTNLSNGKTVNVRVVDRGPHGETAAARNTIIDLSRRAAETLAYTAAGRAPVRVEVLEWGEGLPGRGG